MIRGPSNILSNNKKMKKNWSAGWRGEPNPVDKEKELWKIENGSFPVALISAR